MRVRFSHVLCGMRHMSNNKMVGKRVADPFIVIQYSSEKQNPALKSIKNISHTNS